MEYLLVTFCAFVASRQAGNDRGLALVVFLWTWPLFYLFLGMLGDTPG